MKTLRGTNLQKGVITYTLVHIIFVTTICRHTVCMAHTAIQSILPLLTGRFPTVSYALVPACATLAHFGFREEVTQD